MFKVNNRNSRTRCEVYSELTINTLEQHHWRRSGVFIVNFEHISHLKLIVINLNSLKNLFFLFCNHVNQFGIL